MGAHTHQFFDPFQGLTNADGREFWNPVRPHLHRQGLGTKPLTGTAGTGNQLQIFLQLLALRLAAGITELPLENRKNAFERSGVSAFALAVTAVGLDQNRFAASIEQHIPLLIAELIPGGLDLEAKGFPHREQQGEVVAVVLLCPRRHSRIHRLTGIRNDPVTGELAQMADAMAVLTGAVRAVERKQSR